MLVGQSAMGRLSNAAPSVSDAGMSHGTPLSRLTVGDRRTDMCRRIIVAIVWFALAAAATAEDASQPAAVGVYAMSAGRAAASSAVLIGMIGAIAGGLALARSAWRVGSGGRRGAVVALVLGPIGLAVGSIVVATADGGVGTGHGFAGGVVAVVVGLIGTTLGGLALARSRRGRETARTVAA
jgi:hypothetical protein